jgi:hypothetical protein
VDTAPVPATVAPGDVPGDVPTAAAAKDEPLYGVVPEVGVGSN